MASRFSGFFKRFGATTPAADPTPPAVASTPPPTPAAQPTPTAPSGDVEASLALAQTCVAQGDRDKALALYSKVIELAPERALPYYKRGNLLKDRGQLEESLADYDRAITLDPGYAYALCNRGVVLSRLNRFEAALDSYDRAIVLTPDDALAHFNRAEVLRELKRTEEALASYNRALAIRPDYVECLCNRGILLTALGQVDEARASFDRAIGIHADFADAYLGRAALLQNLYRMDTALADYDRALQLNPNFPSAHCNRGVLFMRLEKWGEALVDFDQALGLNPDYPEAHRNRGDVLFHSQRYVEAIQSYDRALACKPDLAFTRGFRSHVKMMICDWDGWASEVEEITAGIRNSQPVIPPFPLLSIADEVSLHHTAAQLWVREEFPPKQGLPPLLKRAPSEKLRIGYFSADFRDHAVSILMAELFELHDRDRYEITAFAFGAPSQSDMRKRLQKAFDRFVDISDKSDRDAAALVREYEIDIAVDLGGHTRGARTGIFAWRTAPIQVAWLGYPGTVGSEYFDYLIGDPTVIPPEHQPHYSEKIVYLPNCYLPNDSTREIDAGARTREEFGLPPAAAVFCCFNNSYKFAPPVFASLMRILARVEGSVLWLSQGNSLVVGNLQREAERCGVDPKRLIFARHMPSLSQHLARLRLGDLFLDTLPYNAHTTAIDALWSGLPVLTRIGNSFAGRVAASLLKAIELPELITATMEEYEDLAVELGTHPQRLAEIKQKLARNRLTTPLFDTRSLARHLETGYTKMFERYQAGLPPDHIVI
jgi:predicted O-linked N-acetylglucosamine transferase (SPINDLY family)